MFGVEHIIGVVAGVIIPAIGGIAWLQEKGNRRIDSILDKNGQQTSAILSHVQSVEKTLHDMRADLPTRYTLREDHVRLSERVDKLSQDLLRHKESHLD